MTDKRIFECPECASIEDDQYHCCLCEGEKQVTLEDAKRFDWDIDDLSEIVPDFDWSYLDEPLGHPDDPDFDLADDIGIF